MKGPLRAEGASMEPFLQAWLTRLCESFGPTQRGTLWGRKGEDSPPELLAIHPAALRPDSGVATAHRTAATSVFAGGRAAVLNRDEGNVLSVPGTVGGRPMVVVTEQAKGSPQQQASVLDTLARALGWLDWMLRVQGPATASREESNNAGPDVGRTLELLAMALEPRPVPATSLALVTELASLLHCERVSLGRFEGNALVLDAISHTAQLDARTRLARDIVAAMQEAIDQDAVVVHPAPQGETPLAAVAHRQLATEQGLAAIWTIPLRDDEDFAGALLIELAPGQQQSDQARVWLEQLASLLAPVLGLRRREQAPIGERLRGFLRDDLVGALGLDRPTIRIALALGCVVFALLAALPSTHRVTAPARLEGAVQRVIVAPMSGYVAESRRRAGDSVEQGEVLAVLEDADLRLEARKWEAKRNQHRKELRAAMAGQERAKVRILQAQLDQTVAELELISERRRRTRLVAPFSGVVTDGDLSQSLGTPVERGDVLFEVAPKDDYRVILEVEGRDITFVKPEQQGALTLQALPGKPHSLSVRRVTPISSAEGGRNFFRVEARLGGMRAGLRPGMDGVAKIDVGRRSLLWIWTHSILDWVRMAVWKWVP